MIRFGLVGVNTMHAGVFAGIFNGSADHAPTLAGGKVVAVWDSSESARKPRTANWPTSSTA